MSRRREGTGDLRRVLLTGVVCRPGGRVSASSILSQEDAVREEGEGR